MPLEFERLEQRQLLAGNISAAMKGSTLTLSGDAESNGIIINETADGAFVVDGIGTSINGVFGIAVFDGVKNIKVDLKDGDDSFYFSGQNQTSLGRVSIKLGDGNDGSPGIFYGDQFLSGISGMRVNTLSLDCGNGDDAIDISTSQISKSLKIKGGNGNDNISLLSNVITGKTSAKMGNGDDIINVSAFGGAATFTRLVNLNLGGGDDIVNISSSFGEIEFFDPLKINGGSGIDTLSISSSGGPLLFNEVILKNME